MILMQANPLQGPENREFLCPEMATIQASAIWAQNEVQG